MIGLHKHWPDFLELQVTEYFAYIDLKKELVAISNAPLLGGSQAINGILNYKVAKEASDPELLLPPEIALQQQIATLKLTEPCLGLMTAASMKSFRFHYDIVAGYQLLFAVTVGLANTRRIGDSADYREIHPQALPHGTINLMLITDAPLSPSAQQEGFALLIEAKTAACYDEKIISPISGRPATGTGTDVTVIAARKATDTISYCGKHTLLGEKIGGGAYAVVVDALQGCL